MHAGPLSQFTGCLPLTQACKASERAVGADRPGGGGAPCFTAQHMLRLSGDLASCRCPLQQLPGSWSHAACVIFAGQPEAAAESVAFNYRATTQFLASFSGWLSLVPHLSSPLRPVMRSLIRLEPCSIQAPDQISKQPVPSLSTRASPPQLPATALSQPAAAAP